MQRGLSFCLLEINDACHLILQAQYIHMLVYTSAQVKHSPLLFRMLLWPDNPYGKHKKPGWEHSRDCSPLWLRPSDPQMSRTPAAIGCLVCLWSCRLTLSAALYLFLWPTQSHMSELWYIWASDMHGCHDTATGVLLVRLLCANWRANNQDLPLGFWYRSRQVPQLWASSLEIWPQIASWLTAAVWSPLVACLTYQTGI